MRAPSQTGAEALADRIAGAMSGTAGVVSLHGGRWGTAGTYAPGRRIVGVQLDVQRVTVHIVAAFGVTAIQVAANVRQVLAPIVGDRRIDVVIEDLAHVAQPCT